MVEFLKEAARVVPSKRQLDWFEMERYAFVHYGVNTYTDREWGEGTEDEKIFNPTALDCDQWVEAVKSAGLKGLILTAKHHDGFCLWPSKYTEHSVKNSPYKGDVVREAAEACKRGGIKLGFYLSPWDRNSKYYGTPEYNDYFCNQLTELLTGYGDIFCVWFDNACGEGENGKKQEYDFPRYFELIRKYQPNAVIFNDFGPDTRWCGNEAGEARHAEWAVVPSELCFYSEVQTGAGPMAEDGSLSYMYNTNREIGTMPNILYSKGLVFAPAEIDMSIRPGWFWHENEEPHSLERLYNTYLRSCGANACLNLNVPPTREGKFDERDVKRLKEFGDLIRETTENRIPCAVERIGGTPTQPVYELKTEGPVEIGCVVLREDLAHGQRVEGFRILGIDEENKADYALFEGTCIGNKHICELEDPFAVQNPLTGHTNKKLSGVRVQITAARDEVFMREIYITKGKSVCEQK